MYDRPMALPPRVVESDADHTVASWHNVVVTRWVGKVQLPAMEVAFQLGKKLAEQHDRRVVSLTLVENGLNIPGSDVRSRASEMVAAAADYMVLNTTVINGEGFWNSAARAAMTGIIMMSRDKTPHKVFSSVAQVAPVLAPHVDASDVTADGVLRAIESLRQ